METFKEYLDSQSPENLAKILEESSDYTLSEIEEANITDSVSIFLAEGKNINDLELEFTNEGLFGSIRFINFTTSRCCIRCTDRQKSLILTHEFNFNRFFY